MNKRYIDFVPSKKTGSEVAGSSKAVTTPKVSAPRAVAPKAATRPAVKPALRAVTPKPTVKSTVRPVARTAVKSVKKAGNEAELGVVEDLGAVKGASAMPVEKPVEKSKKGVGRTFQVPKNPFINQNKVEKRPLSKNVYQKKIVVPNEEPKGPVTIISKPEKDAHVSLIVAVILTIILGAAAGTVAFLLLPK